MPPRENPPGNVDPLNPETADPVAPELGTQHRTRTRELAVSQDEAYRTGEPGTPPLEEDTMTLPVADETDDQYWDRTLDELTREEERGQDDLKAEIAMLEAVRRECEELEKTFVKVEGGRAAPAPIATTCVEASEAASNHATQGGESAACWRERGATVHCRDCEMWFDEWESHRTGDKHRNLLRRKQATRPARESLAQTAD
eukprot:9484650-Heterocapsa_arctica.AAC.1